jgi:signal peptidase
MLIYNIAIIAQRLRYPNKTPIFLGRKTYVIISGSMEPYINIGDVLIEKKIDENQLKVGDVITYRKADHVVTHRIIKITYNSLGKMLITTKGDNNEAEDYQKVYFSEIEGRVEKIIPKIGLLALVVKHKSVITLVIVLACLYLFRYTRIQIKKHRRRLERLKYEKDYLDKLHHQGI